MLLAAGFGGVLFTATYLALGAARGATLIPAQQCLSAPGSSGMVSSSATRYT